MLIKKYLSLLVACMLIISCSEETPVSTSQEPLGYTSVGPPAQSLTEFESVLERIRLKTERLFGRKDLDILIKRAELKQHRKLSIIWLLLPNHLQQLLSCSLSKKTN